MKNTPCILAASKGQQRTEQAYYREVFGFQGDFLFADNLDEARVMVVQNNGFMPTDDGVEHLGDTTVRLPIRRGDCLIRQHYCAFWKADHPDCYAKKIAELLKEELIKTGE